MHVCVKLFPKQNKLLQMHISTVTGNFGRMHSRVMHSEELPKCDDQYIRGVSPAAGHSRGGSHKDNSTGCLSELPTHPP